MNKYLFKSAIVIIAFSHCTARSDLQKAQVSPITDITHYNIIIVPDLSNRLKRLATLSDPGIVDSLLHNIYPNIAKIGRTTDQKDSYKIILSSTRLGTLFAADFSKMNIDLGSFKNDQMARVEYLMGRNKDHNLKTDVSAFISEFTRIETLAQQQTDGADLWSFLNTGLENDMIAYPEVPFTFNRRQYRSVHRNILVLLTDGYIEAGLSPAQGCNDRQCRYLSGSLINQFRQAYQRRSNKEESLQIFFQRSHYGITPVSNPYLNNFEVLMLEGEDRSLTRTGNATVSPTDFEIIQLFWKDWMKQSGVQHFEMYPIARDAQVALDHIMSFLQQKTSK